MVDPFTLSFFGKALIWVCTEVCSWTIGKATENRILARLSDRQLSRRNSDLESALKDAFSAAALSFADTAPGNQSVYWEQIRDVGIAWLLPDNPNYPSNLLAAVLFERPESVVWKSIWNPLENDLEHIETRPFFISNRRSFEDQLRKSFSLQLRLQRHRVAFNAYLLTVLTEIVQSPLTDPIPQTEQEKRALLKIEEIVAVQDALAKVSEAVLTAIDRKSDHLVEIAKHVKESVESTLSEVNEVRLLVAGEYIRSDGSSFRASRLEDCERVRQTLLQRPLVGRRTQLGSLSVRVEEHRLVAVTGDSGVGKSAFLSHWIEIVSGDPTVALCYHFFSREDDTARIDGGMRCLVEQLLITHGIRGQPPIALDDVKAVFRRLLGFDHFRRLVIVIDGVDEALDGIRAGAFAFGRGWFPQVLGDNVMVVLGTRFGAGIADISELENGIAVGSINEFRLDNLDVDAIQDLLPQESRSLAGSIEQRTGGLAIYASAVAEAIRREPDNAARAQLVEILPDSFVEYVTEGLATAAAASRQWVRALGCLAAASGPLDTSELLRISRSAPPFLQAVDLQSPNWSIGRWLRERSGYWSFQHDSIAEAYREGIRPDLQEFRQQILDDSQNWSEHKGPYSLRFFAGDLLAARKYDQLYCLALNPEYREMQVRHYAGQPRLSLDTLQAAIRGMVLSKSWEKVARLLLIHLSVARMLHKESPLGAARIGELERAIQLANERDDVHRVLWLLLLAWNECSSGSRINCSRMLGLVQLEEFKVDVVKHEDIGSKIVQLSGLESIIDSTDLAAQRADELGVLLPHAFSVDERTGLRMHDDWLSNTGEFFGEWIPTPPRITRAREYLENDDLSSALSTLGEAQEVAKRISRPRSKAATYAEIAQVLFQLERTEEAVGLIHTALESANEIEDAKARATIYAGITQILFTVDQEIGRSLALDSALLAAQKIRDERFVADLHLHIALLLNSHYDQEGAIDTIEKALLLLESREHDNATWYFKEPIGALANALLRISVQRAKTVQPLEKSGEHGVLSRELNEVLDLLAEHIGNRHHLDIKLLAEICDTQAGIGQAEAAKKNLRKAIERSGVQGDLRQKAKLLNDLAQIQIDADEVEEAKANLASALGVARNLNILTGDEELFGEIANSYVLMAHRSLSKGDLAKSERELGSAFYLTEVIENQTFKMKPLEAICRAHVEVYRHLCRTGIEDEGFAQLKAAATASERIKLDWFKAPLIAELAANIEDTNLASEVRLDFASAVESAMRLDPRGQITKLKEIAEIQLSAGKRDLAVDTIKIAVPIAQQLSSRELGRLAQSLVDANDIDGARAVLVKARDLAEDNETVFELLQIAEIFVSAEEMEEAQLCLGIAATKIQELGDLEQSVQANCGLANIQSAIRNEDAQVSYAVARKLIEGIEDEKSKSQRLLWLATQQFSTGQITLAKETLTAAFHSAMRLPPSWSKAQIVGNIAGIGLERYPDMDEQELAELILACGYSEVSIARIAVVLSALYPDCAIAVAKELAEHWQPE